MAAFYGRFNLHTQHEALADSISLSMLASVKEVVDKVRDGIIGTQSLNERTIFIRRVVETMDVSPDSRQRAIFTSLHGLRVSSAQSLTVTTLRWGSGANKIEMTMLRNMNAHSNALQHLAMLERLVTPRARL